MKIPNLFKKKKKLDAIARRIPQARAIDDYDQEPSMKLSSAFIVALALHVVAVGGVYTFNSIKAHRNEEARSADKVPAVAGATGVANLGAASASAAVPPAPAVTEARHSQKGDPSAGSVVKSVKTSETAAKAYTVAKGDSPASIARKFGISSEELLRLNKIDDPKKLQIGQKLRIPAKAAKTTAPARAEG